MEETVVMHDLSWAQEPTPWPWWIWALIVFGIVLVLAVGTFLLRRRRRMQAAAQVPAIPAHVTALEALDRLGAKLGQQDDLEFVIEVSSILRVYIQQRFNIRAPHRSTEEFLREASRSTVLTADEQRLLADFLGLCDRVKFARHHVVLEQMKELFDIARQFVLETAEKSEPTPEEVAA